MSDSQRSKKKVLRVLLRTSDKVRTLERDFPITQIAWMSLNGELAATGDAYFQRDLMAISKRTNDYKRKYWKLEESIKQEFLHRMTKMRFSPASSPEIETLKNNLPPSILKDDGRLWTYSYDYYIEEIAKKVGRSRSEAPTGSAEYEYYSRRFQKEKKKLHKEALDLLRYLNEFTSTLKEYIRSEGPWKVEPRSAERTIPLEGKKPLILIKRPFPIPRSKRPRKSLFRRLKRETIGPEGKR